MIFWRLSHVWVQPKSTILCHILSRIASPTAGCGTGRKMYKSGVLGTAAYFFLWGGGVMEK